MPEQPSTLAARIRARYPGVYDDIADIELEQRVATKFPGAYDDIPRTEATLTRERQAPGTPSALSAGHHPETLSGGRHADALRAIESWQTPSDTAFLKRAPEVGGAAGMLVGGPVGAGLGAAAGSLVKGQFERGPHVPTTSDMTGAAAEGGTALVLGGAPVAALGGARTLGPMVAKHAGALSRGASALTGGGTWLASGNPLMGLGASAATKAVTSPGAIRAVGNAATRAGSTVPEHAAYKAGFGAISAAAFRQALLDALGQEPEQP